MKIVVHFGLPKTGTTSLQNAFFASRAKLREHGVVYPDGGAGRENHKVLTALYRAPERVRFDVRGLFDDDAQMRRAAAAMWEEIKAEVARARPALLILSSEYFAPNPHIDDFARFASLLNELSSDLTLCVYFRESAAIFASHLQQGVKNGRRLLKPSHSKAPDIVAKIEEAFGQQIVACNGDRGQLIGGEIVADFLARFVTPVVGPIDVSTVRLNESISAEAMAVLYRFRTLRYPGADGPMPDFYSLRTILAAEEARIGTSGSPKARPEIAQALRRGARELLWLRERYGLVFDAVDYDRIDGELLVFDPEQTMIEDLFVVDPRRRDELEAAALAEGMAAWKRMTRKPRSLSDLSRVVGAASGGLLGGLRRGRSRVRPERP